jgi:hypothetical protein
MCWDADVGETSTGSYARGNMAHADVVGTPVVVNPPPSRQQPASEP